MVDTTLYNYVFNSYQLSYPLVVLVLPKISHFSVPVIRLQSLLFIRKFAVVFTLNFAVLLKLKLNLWVYIFLMRHCMEDDYVLPCIKKTSPLSPAVSICFGKRTWQHRHSLTPSNHHPSTSWTDTPTHSPSPQLTIYHLTPSASTSSPSLTTTTPD